MGLLPAAQIIKHMLFKTQFASQNHPVEGATINVMEIVNGSVPICPSFHTVAISRGAAAGAILKGGLHISSWLMHQLRSSARQNLNSLSLGRALADTFTYTAFLGSLAGLYVAVDEALASIFGKVRSVAWMQVCLGRSVEGQEWNVILLSQSLLAYLNHGV